MVIAVNIVYLQENPLNVIRYFVQHVFEKIARQHSTHRFVFLCNKDVKEGFVSGENIEYFQIPSTSKNKLATKFWYDITLPLALKKIKPDVLIQTSGVCSITTNIPQVLILHDLKWYPFFRKNFLTKASHIITISQKLKEHLNKVTEVPDKKISIALNAAMHQFIPADADTKMQTKDGDADGREYFLLLDEKLPTPIIEQVLKAFSLFKKWQKSNMKLLIVEGKDKSEIEKKLETYKYKDDVILFKSINEGRLINLTAAAYCVLYPACYENNMAPVLNAQQTHVPAIVNDTEEMRAFFAHTVLYADYTSTEKIAQQMQLIYKDELLRSQLIEKGVEHVKQFSWQQTTGNVWKAIKGFF